MLTVYAPAPLPRATNDLLAAATDNDHAITPQSALAFLKAHPLEVLKAAGSQLQKSEDGLGPGDPWLNNNLLAFIPLT